MSKVFVDLSMSLDGFIAGPNDNADQPLGEGGGSLLAWMNEGDIVSSAGLHPKYHGFFRARPENAKFLDELFTTMGAVVCGRRTYDLTNGWNGTFNVRNVPVFILTHEPPAAVPEGDTQFTFVTDGIESAVRQAKAAAGDKDVGVGAANVAQQALRAGLLDELRIHLAPVLLGGGVRLFDHLDGAGIELEKISVVDTPSVTHLRYRVVRNEEGVEI
jgi:dihydrofolate reductase